MALKLQFVFDYRINQDSAVISPSHDGAHPMKYDRPLLAALAAQAATPATPTAQPAPALAQKIATIERRREVQAHEATANRIKTPQVVLAEKGLAVTTPDGNFEMKQRGYVQLDGRFWLADKRDDDTDTLLFRRVRPIIEGTVYKNFYYRLMADFASNAVTLQDGYGEWRQCPFARLGFGKIKTPLGVEQLQSAAELEFVERGLPRNLIPNRDFGVVLTGDLFGERLNYTVGAFNGAPDLASTGASDNNDDKDFVGRLFALPFKDWHGPLQALGLGLSGSYGKEELSVASNNVTAALGSYVTPGPAAFLPLAHHQREHRCGRRRWQDRQRAADYCVGQYHRRRRHALSHHAAGLLVLASVRPVRRMGALGPGSGRWRASRHARQRRLTSAGLLGVDRPGCQLSRRAAVQELRPLGRKVPLDRETERVLLTRFQIAY